MGYISKNTVIGKLLYEQEKLKGRGPLAPRKVIDRCINTIAVMDEEHVVQERHACWEPSEHKGFVGCSWCKDCFIEEECVDGYKWRYCPQCGAKMDDAKEANDNE